MIMSKRSSLHPYAKWTKKRIDQMDVALGDIEASANRMKADFMAKSDRMIADLKKQRDKFEAALKKHGKTNGKAVDRARERLEAQWKNFDAQVKGYFTMVERRFAPRQTAFQRLTAVQAKAWHKASRSLRLLPKTR